jgi:hypothetical protein
MHGRWQVVDGIWVNLAFPTYHIRPTTYLSHTPGPLYFLRGATPGPFFFTLGLREPRGSVRFGLGAAFLRAARFSFLRSSLSLMLFVFIV